MMKTIIWLLLLMAAALSASASYQFAGEDADAVSNVIYLRGRCYDPQTGRFLSKDPLGVAGGTNAYQYVMNNPVNDEDPTGLIGVIFYNPVASNSPIFATGFQATAQALATASNGQIVAEPISGTNSLANASTYLNGLNQSGTPIDDISVFDHGSPGSQNFGDSSLNSNNVTLLTQYMNPTGTLSLYGCNVAANVQFPTINGSSVMQDMANASLTTIRANTGVNTFSSTGQLTENVPQNLTENQYVQGYPATGQTQVFAPSGGNLQTTPDLPDLASDDSISSLNVGGVLINEAATLVGSNLSSIQGATYDPTTKQIIFMGAQGSSNSTLTNINMDYFYTAIQAVYGSATPPYVTLDPPASAATQWPFIDNSTSTGNYLLLLLLLLTALFAVFPNLCALCVLGVKIPFYLTDRLGSVRLITSSTGAITATYNYDAFGASR